MIKDSGRSEILLCSQDTMLAEHRPIDSDRRHAAPGSEAEDRLTDCITYGTAGIMNFVFTPDLAPMSHRLMWNTLVAATHIADLHHS